jgi:hypothetical protein
MIDVCNSVDQLKNDRASIYPVPSNGIINISKVSENYYLNVIDMTGRLVIANVFVRAGENKTVTLPSGLYSFQLMSESRKLIMQKKVSVVK